MAPIEHLKLLDSKKALVTTCLPVSPEESPRHASSMGLGDIVYERALRNPDGPAVDFEGRILTNAQLHYHAILLARQLTETGIQSDEAIGIMTQAGYEQIVAQVAVVYAGGTCCALDPTLPEPQVQYRLTNAGARICLADKASLHLINGFQTIEIVVQRVKEDVARDSLRLVPKLTGREHRTHLMHTSGSTGKPKTVQIKAKALLHLSGDDRNVPIGTEDRTCQMAMVSFDISLFEIWVTLIRGATIIPMPRSLLKDMHALARAWRDLKVTVLLVPASLFPMVVFAMPTVFSGMQVVYSGGEPPNLPAMRTVLEQGPPKHLFNCYGPTECCIFSLVHELTLEDTKSAVSPLTRVIADTKLCILDDNHQPVRDGEVGELYIGGDGVSPGYVNLPEKTAERFVSSRQYPSLPPSCNFYATGDLVRRDKSGEYFVMGRLDNQVKIRGFRVELEGVEAAMMDTGLVSAAAACKVQTDEDDMGATLVAFVVPNSPQTFSVDKLLFSLKRELPDYLVPQVEVHETLPLNGHSKIDRAKLIREFLAAGSKNALQAADGGDDNSIIGRLRKIWHSVLPGYSGVIKDDDTFTSLGGSSLQAAMLLIRIKREFSVQVTAVVLYEDTSLAAMARYIEAGGEEYTIHAAHNRAFRKDVNFYDSLNLDIPPGSPPRWDTEYEGRIILTGATGFVGAFALQALLTAPETTTVICIVRAKNDEAARQRVIMTQCQYGLMHSRVPYHKLVVLAGDLKDSTLGLGPELFQQLGYWASAVFHLAAHVNYAEPYATHRDANVLGTANILRLQAAGRPKRLHYMSTLNIYGPTGLVNGYTRVKEDSPVMNFVDAVQYDNGYAQSKWVAEKMIADAIHKHNLPITTYRPGAVFCHSKTGIGNATDFVSRLIESSVRMGCFPKMLHQSKNFIPVDHLVNAMIHLSRQDRTIGQFYNMVPEMQVQPEQEITQFFRALEAVLHVPLVQVSYDQWLERLKQQGDDDPLTPLIPMLEERVFDGHSRWQMYEKMPIYDTTNLKRDLSDAPDLAECRQVDEALLRKFLPTLNLVRS